MKKKDYSYYSYYDGHYKDSGLSAEERERLDKEVKEKPAPQRWEEAFDEMKKIQTNKKQHFA